MRVAFLDRDGTLIYEPPDGLVRPNQFRILEGVIDGLRRLKDQGYVLVMVTNQDFTRPENPEQCFEETQTMLINALAKEGIVFDHIFLCPHHIDAGCACRKPKTGMVDKFLQEHEIDKERSFVVGDREVNDGGLAKNLGIKYCKMESNGGFPEIDILLSRL